MRGSARLNRCKVTKDSPTAKVFGKKIYPLQIIYSLIQHKDTVPHTFLDKKLQKYDINLFLKLYLQL